MLGIYDQITGDYRVNAADTLCDFVKIEYDEKTKILLIDQGMFGTVIPLYFLVHQQKIIICDSLMELKKNTDFPFYLNEQMLPYFFYNGFLPDKHTLIKGVYKLPPKTKVQIQKGVLLFYEKELLLTDKKSSEDELASRYDKAVDCAVRKETEKIAEEDICMAISAGFDSNCILHMIRKQQPKRTVRAFSIGGIRGVDETASAREIVEYYQNVQFSRGEVTPETLKKLDDIVFRLEGSVYERGIFLQYELGRLLQQEKVRYFVCGECADQIFHEKTYVPIPKDNFLYGYWDTPYEMAAYVVLPKNALMMRSFGIKGLYPFLDPDVVQIGYETRKQNGRTKEFHKAQCKKNLPEYIMSYIEKQGGSTSLEALFPEGYKCREDMEKNQFYSKDFRITQKYSPMEAEYDYYLSMLYLESFKRQFCDE